MKEKSNLNIEAVIYNYIDEFKSLILQGKKDSVLLDYSKNEVLAILFLYRKKVTNVSEIAEYIEAPLNTATGVISRLEKKNIVERRRDSEDKRVVNIIFTKTGEELFENEKELYSSYIIKVYNALSDEEKATALSIINKVISVLKAENSETNTDEKPVKRVKRINIE